MKEAFVALLVVFWHFQRETQKNHENLRIARLLTGIWTQDFPNAVALQVRDVNIYSRESLAS